MAMPIPQMTLGVRLYMARRGARLEQEAIAKACSVSRALVSRWERDLSEPKPSQLRVVAEVTGCSYSWLVDPDNASFLSSSEAPSLLLPDGRPAFDFRDSQFRFVAA